MIQSMTGYGSAEDGPFKVEIRSLNHRFLEVFIRIPQSLGNHELPMRNLVRERFSRGRFDVFVSMADGKDLAVRINMDLAKEICNSLRALKEELSLSGEIGIESIASFKDIIITEETEFNTESLYRALINALNKVAEMRTREGEALARDVLVRIDLLENLKDRVASICPEVAGAREQRHRERLHSLLGDVEFDENRVLQEAAFLAEKADISEEVTRLSSHIGQLKKILADGDTIGRKVEFLLQELNREVNTIASKADDYRISSIAVEMKAEIEKIREQAQNMQ
jgi:uncharacterized protein (TIGR00255 family)